MTSRRNMGWRKPVPQFIPESTISSRLSRASFKRFSITSTSPDAPPLPSDWRETIERALGRNKRSAFYMGRDTNSTDDVLPIDAVALGQNSSFDATQHAALEGKDNENMRLGEEQKLASTPLSLKQEHPLPQGYRPPTPPLRGHRSKPSAGHGSPRHDPPSIRQHVVFSGMSSSPDVRFTQENSAPFPPYSPGIGSDGSLTAANSREDWSTPRTYLPEMKVRRRRRSSTSSTTTAGLFAGKYPRCRDTFISIWGDVRLWGGYIRVKFGHKRSDATKTPVVY